VKRGKDYTVSERREGGKGGGRKEGKPGVAEPLGDRTKKSPFLGGQQL